MSSCVAAFGEVSARVTGTTHNTHTNTISLRPYASTRIRYFWFFFFVKKKLYYYFRSDEWSHVRCATADVHDKRWLVLLAQ